MPSPDKTLPSGRDPQPESGFAEKASPLSEETPSVVDTSRRANRTILAGLVLSTAALVGWAGKVVVDVLKAGAEQREQETKSGPETKGPVEFIGVPGRTSNDLEEIWAKRDVIVNKSHYTLSFLGPDGKQIDIHSAKSVQAQEIENPQVFGNNGLQIHIMRVSPYNESEVVEDTMYYNDGGSSKNFRLIYQRTAPIIIPPEFAASTSENTSTSEGNETSLENRE